MWLDDALAYDLIDNHKMVVEEYIPRPTKEQRKEKAKESKRVKISPL